MNTVLANRNLRNRRWRLRVRLPMYLVHRFTRWDVADGYVTIESRSLHSNSPTYRHYWLED